ncbi:MAG: hypothetical protein ACYTE5_06940, partial [Planctomycetota bacterium]
MRVLSLLLVFALASVAGGAAADILDDIQLVLHGTTVEVISLDASVSWAYRSFPAERGEPVGVFGIYV